ncbi:MAG: hypothetical protein ACRDNF_26765 [Streptosporangiaceae bacterium]
MVIFAALSGPSSPVAMSTPWTLKVVGVNDPWKEPPPPPPPPPPKPPPAPSVELNDGIVPVTFVSVRVRPPAAAATSGSFATVVTEVVARLPSPCPRSVSTSIFVPAAGLVPELPKWPPKPNEPGVPEPSVGVLLTVMSVPTPYSECSTLPCAFLTPLEAEVTVMTRPIPSARPSAMKIA